MSAQTMRFFHASAPLRQRVRRLRLSLVEQALFRSRAQTAVVTLFVGSLQTLRSRGRACFAWCLAAWAKLWTHLAPWLAGRAQRARVHLTSSAMRVASQLHNTRRLTAARLRYLVSSLLVSLRSLQWRQHASSLLIATAISIAVARSQTSPDGR
jgi:hypothetical protein